VPIRPLAGGRSDAGVAWPVPRPQNGLPMFAGLVRLILTLSLAGAVLWLALPVAASTLAGVAVGAAGLHGDDVSVAVNADPPFKLLLLQADSVRVRSGPSTWRGVTFAQLDLTFTGLRLGAAPSTVEGRLDGVEFPDRAGVTVRAGTVFVSGADSTPDVRVEFAAADFESLVGRALPAGLSGATAPLELIPPDQVRIQTALGEVVARLVLGQDGRLNLALSEPGVGSVTIALIEPGPALPLQLQSVAVDGGKVVLRGTVDARSIGL
jgi:hypothetical protein